MVLKNGLHGNWSCGSPRVRGDGPVGAALICASHESAPRGRAGGRMRAQPVPDWLLPPPQGFRADDLDGLPGLPPHTELIDGSLILAAPQSILHSLVIDLLVSGLRAGAAEGHRVRREISVVLDERQRPEPDAIVVRDVPGVEASRTAYPAEAVVLA